MTAMLPVVLAMATVLAAGTASASPASAASPAGANPAGAPAPTYAALAGKVVLENERVRVEQFVLPPGASTGRHFHPADQLLIFVRGGVLRSADTGRSVRWQDGRVAWHAAGEAADGGDINVGTTPIEMTWVTVKPWAGAAAHAGGPSANGARGATGGDWPADAHLNYPNIPGEDLLENEQVVVQRFVVAPGQWEGVHAHRPNMLYVHIHGGQWSARSKTEAEHLYPAPSADGKVGWMPTTPLSVGHESRNAGKEPIDLIWVTLKRP
ncbi:MAG: hypothetical protein JSR67_14880 [Proteobacteria bacterium]|nr:hypothetical protein [Pseudomonadota bacterium]